MKAWLVALCILCPVWSHSRLSAQDLLPQKDLGFAQIAAGPTIETVITLTNRGAYEYQGVLHFSRDREGLEWNPVINGQPVQGGAYPLTIGVDEVVVLRVTSGTLQIGAGILVANDLIPDNFVEAALSYYIRSGGRIVDSVGVLAGQEFYLATIPFEDFSTVGLALANSSILASANSQIALNLLDGAGNFIDGTLFSLPPYGHDAQFLFEHFPDVSRDLGTGKVEIVASSPVIGTALMLVGPTDAPQLSTLPLAPAPTAYEFTITALDDTRFDGTMALWAEGFFVKGYLVVSSVNGVTLPDWGLTLVAGQLIDGFLDLSFFAESANFFGESEARPNEETTVYMGHKDFTFGDSDATGGRFILMYLDDRATLTGTFTLTRITP